MILCISKHGISLARPDNVDKNQHLLSFFKDMGLDSGKLCELSKFINDAQLLSTPIFGDKNWCG